MANNINKNNDRMMQLTYENATFLNYITGYLQAYAKAGLELSEMFRQYLDDDSLSDESKVLVQEMYNNYNIIISDLRNSYLPK